MAEGGDGIRITMSTSMWIHWAQIAVRRANDARAARASSADDRLGVETQEAISAVCAVAFSMEALQRMIVTQLTADSWGERNTCGKWVWRCRMV